MNSSKWKLILSTLTVILLIVPTCYMLTFGYYAFGTKSTTLMDVASTTLYITEPNTTLEEMEFEMDFSLFSMDLSFEQYKQIGDEFYPSKDYDLHFVLNDLVNNKTTSKLEKIYPQYPTQTNQWITHPNQSVEFNSDNEWRVLSGLPEETVVEAYISLDDLYLVQEVEDEMKNVDVTWAAIYTGTEDKMLSSDGDVISPIGYPVQPDQTYWSPFRDSESHEETFLKMLKNLQPYEDIAVEVSSHKNLELEERIHYIEKNGYKTYGVVVTGPKSEIQSLREIGMVRYLKLGEVKLWNWAQ
ncbi:anti sigma factor C-terminal domain-containing protein [Psychrobacillus sp. NEAU-3TGS]|uniref:anti-sigma factor n=1 Tax=Psychrobacillus sp. NEAU-3TGS TaxID=2995412 RepID=UPI002499475F|nr:anti-sigma factor [Psychrobacillus sp. NEAU-3TGS]MDI2586192.1 anti sigma factor C-terminal domain-containing protein [Psychrobacillus sp. NEAU-3TGS]